jgi:hypothetical protein
MNMSEARLDWNHQVYVNGKVELLNLY